MTATTYYAVTAEARLAEARLAEAQRTLDVHVTSSATGLCLMCGIPGPCPAQEAAAVAFFRSLCLPLRRPGATRPEMVGARLVGRGGLRAGLA